MAINVLLLTHVPPEVVVLKTVAAVSHTALAPVIAAGAEITVNGVVDLHEPKV